MAEREVNLPLLDFLVKLSTDAKLRGRFAKKSERPAIYKLFKLNKVAIDTLNKSDSATVDAEVNQQVATGGGGGGGNG